jgi:hypothetical protein
MAVDADPGTALGGPASARPGSSPTAPALVRALAAVPGSTHAAVVDERSGALLAESGSAGSDTPLTALLTWARRTTARPGPGDLDDLVVTTDRAFHVLRRRTAGGGPVWTYLRVDRSRGNLALARRAAATAAAPARPPASRPVGLRSGLPKRPPTALPAAPRAVGSHPPPPPIPSTAPAPAAALPAPTGGWSADTDTLRRLLDGLQRLA